MCWSGVVLGVTGRKGHVDLSLPWKEQPSQWSPRPLRQGQQSLFPNLFFFRNWAAASAFWCCRVCRCCRNHWGRWKNKSCWGGWGVETTSGKQGPIIIIKTHYSVCMLLRSLDISDQKLSWKLQLEKITCIQNLDPAATELHLLKTSSDTMHSQGSHVRLHGQFSRDQYTFQKIDPKFTYQFFSQSGKNLEWNRQKLQEIEVNFCFLKWNTCNC